MRICSQAVRTAAVPCSFKWCELAAVPATFGIPSAFAAEEPALKAHAARLAAKIQKALLVKPLVFSRSVQLQIDLASDMMDYRIRSLVTTSAGLMWMQMCADSDHTQLINPRHFFSRTTFNTKTPMLHGENANEFRVSQLKSAAC